jgi:hypothetical protein
MAGIYHVAGGHEYLPALWVQALRTEVVAVARICAFADAAMKRKETENRHNGGVPRCSRVQRQSSVIPEGYFANSTTSRS